MNKINPFKKIESDVSLPEELKEDILQEIEQITEEEKNDEQSNNPKK